jgi:DNA-directed RNA polymerase subunit omega
MTIETSFDSNYRKVLVAARRARQIQSGSHALVPTQSTKACRIA